MDFHGFRQLFYRLAPHRQPLGILDRSTTVPRHGSACSPILSRVLRAFVVNRFVSAGPALRHPEVRRAALYAVPRIAAPRPAPPTILRGAYPERTPAILRYAQNDSKRRAQNDQLRGRPSSFVPFVLSWPSLHGRLFASLRVTGIAGHAERSEASLLPGSASQRHICIRNQSRNSARN